MIKYALFSGLLLAACMQAATQSPPDVSAGVNFEKGQSWEEIRKKAKAENKFIFVDGWTTWCSPCVYMNKKVFPSNAVGKFVNKHFISVKLQFDSTAKDDVDVVKWYSTAKEFMKRYKVGNFPTFLFFSPDGEIIHRAEGMLVEDGFLDLCKSALDPRQQYYTLKEMFYAGNRDTAMLYRLSRIAGQAADQTLAQETGDAYLAQQDDLFSTKNLQFIRFRALEPHDPAFLFLCYNQVKVDSILGKGQTVSIVGHKFIYSRLTSFLLDKEYKPLKKIDWLRVENVVRAELSTIDRIFVKELVEWIKANYDKPSH